MSVAESIVEDAAVEWFLLRPAWRDYGGQVGELAYSTTNSERLAPGEPAAERSSFADVVQTRCARTLTPALSQKEREKREAIRRLNPAIHEEALHGGVIEFSPNIST